LGIVPDRFLLKLAMPHDEQKPRKLAPVWRVSIEVGFIVFLFYSNLLMGEFTRSNEKGKSFVFALEDIFTMRDFMIAIICGLVGYRLFEYLRKRV